MKTNNIEAVDKQRVLFLQWYLIGLGPFLVLSITRFFFRQGGLNSQPIGTAVLIGMLISLLILAISTIGSATLCRKIKDDPTLKDALNDELVIALEVQSWKAAFIGAVTITVFFALVSFVYPVNDPVLIALTSIITGAGAYRANFYFQYKSS
jgi:hypothetical protein